MHIDEAIRSRRAVKGYDPAFTLSEAEKDELLQLALFAPSAFNLQHVRLVEVGKERKILHAPQAPASVTSKPSRCLSQISWQLSREVGSTAGSWSSIASSSSRGACSRVGPVGQIGRAHD